MSVGSLLLAGLRAARSSYIARSACHICLQWQTSNASLFHSSATARDAIGYARGPSYSHESTGPGIGLFGLPELRQPSDLSKMMHDARSRCEDLVAGVLSAQPGVKVVQLMDEMSDTLCRCYDAAEACRNIHDDPSWRAAASEVCYALGAYITTVNHHQGLYAALKAAVKTARVQRPDTNLQHQHTTNNNTTGSLAGAASTHDATNRTTLGMRNDGVLNSEHLDNTSGSPAINTSAGWCPESVRVAEQLALDMEKAGIHLPPQQRQRMQASNWKRTLVIHHPVGCGCIILQELMNENNHYAANFHRALRDPRKLGSIRLHSYDMTLDPANVGSVMAHETNERNREAVWLAASRSPLSNLALLDAMIAGRHEQATLIGRPSYCHYKAYGSSLAGNPDAIVHFLQQLATDIRTSADKEIKGLATLKQKLQGVLSFHPARVMPWDTEYLMAAAHKAAGDLSHGALNDYMHLPRVLEGFSELMFRCLGLSMKIRPAGHAESWAHGVLRCDVDHLDMGPLGTVYLDLCSRPGKFSSAVTFPIRCGRQLPDGSYQAPIMALLADFGPAHGAPKDVRLAARELRVLLHEWGHCVHALVSRTKFQHLSGTRCAQDLVELPSHLFEHWAADPRSLRILARHHSSRDPLPAGAATALIAQRGRFASLELQQQLLLSLADQALFGADPPAMGGTSEAWRAATEPYSSLPWIAGSHPEARMSHLTIYGSTYYSYVYARCLSTATWNTLFSTDPLDPAAGKALIDSILKHGGAKEPVQLIQDALGSDALQQHASGGWAPHTDALLIKTALAAFG